MKLGHKKKNIIQLNNCSLKNFSKNFLFWFLVILLTQILLCKIKLCLFYTAKYTKTEYQMTIARFLFKQVSSMELRPKMEGKQAYLCIGSSLLAVCH